MKRRRRLACEMIRLERAAEESVPAPDPVSIAERCDRDKAPRAGARPWGTGSTESICGRGMLAFSRAVSLSLSYTIGIALTSVDRMLYRVLSWPCHGIA